MYTSIAAAQHSQAAVGSTSTTQSSHVPSLPTHRPLLDAVREHYTPSNHGQALAKSSHGTAHLNCLRQLVREQFWSISRLRSTNTSSRLVMVSHCRQRVSLTSLPWKMSCTQVLTGCCCALPLLLLPLLGASPAGASAPCFCCFSRPSPTWLSR